MSPRDQLVNVEYGNDAVDTWQYGPANGQMSAMMSGMPGLPDLLADLAYDYDEVGNLVLQTNYLTNVEEQFNYDQLHRITSSIIGPMSATKVLDTHTLTTRYQYGTHTPCVIRCHHASPKMPETVAKR